MSKRPVKETIFLLTSLIFGPYFKRKFALVTPEKISFVLLNNARLQRGNFLPFTRGYKKLSPAQQAIE